MRRDSLKAFTMIELLLVVIILATIATLAIPNFSRSFVRLQLEQTANHISYVMRYAQSRAIQKNLQQKLVFNANFREYTLQQEAFSPEETTPEKKFGKIFGRWGQTFSIPAGIEVQSLQNEINFFPDGKIDRLRIYVCQKDQCMTVTTKEQQGYVDVYNERLP